MATNNVGKVYLVTGGNSGIGRGAAMALAKEDMSATVIIASRTMEKNIAACEKITEKTGNKNVIPMALELGSLLSVKQFAAEFKEKYTRLDGLCANAGVMHAGDTERTLSKDGFEITFATNHLGHFLLLRLLTPLLNSTATTTGSIPRIVITSSYTINPKGPKTMVFPSLVNDIEQAKYALPIGKEPFDGFQCYSNSKLLNALTGHYMSNNLEALGLDPRIQVATYDPGLVPTHMMRKGGMIGAFIFRTALPFIMQFVWSKNSTVERSGGYLAKLANGGIPNMNAKWFSLDYEEDWVGRATDPGLNEVAWKESMELVKNYL